MNMRGIYVLDDDGEPLRCPDLMIWGHWMVTANRIIAFTTLGDVEVSTIFLGIDHRFLRTDRPPILWETMIFGGLNAGYTLRYTSKAEALDGHARAVSLVKAEQEMTP